MIIADWQSSETIDTLTITNNDFDDGSTYSDDGTTDEITLYDGADSFTGMEVGVTVQYNGSTSFIRGPLRCWISYETPTVSGASFTD
ncbi:hypothetical protein [Thalassoroseus pseudoceratinae]|uniref:hypothetical protein n=1 Tax=Thalassoroseus pseudoceratinae TaxID=2713176 RepID=UPI001424A11F|nr:hypothetical protein [Thalassoroseus pseudoceratinae]